MKTFAYIVNGSVAEVIPPKTFDQNVYANDGSTVLHKLGDEVDISERYSPEFVRELIDVTGVSPTPERGWVYNGTTFAAPVPYVPSEDDILSGNSVIQSSVLAAASIAIAPLQLAVSLGDANDEETTLAKEWVGYTRLLKAVDLTVTSPNWPPVPSV